MSAIPAPPSTKNLIDSVQVGDDIRGYLGMSSIGDNCARKLWYKFHFAVLSTSHSARAERIFEFGHYIEGFIIKDLKSVGYEVYRYDGDEKVELFGFKDEEQDACVGVAGHFRGHTDGNVSGIVEAPKTEHLLECKSHNEKNFNKLVKNKVKKAFPKHYDQCQSYMHYRKLKRALYVGFNKNTCEYYFERIYYDKDHAEDLIRKAEFIIMSPTAPEKQFPPTWYECKYCEFREVCHQGAEPDRNCRTCSEVDICNDGKWECGMDGKELSLDDQIKGCEYYRKGWEL